MKSELKHRISDRGPLFSGIGAGSRQKANPEPLNGEWLQTCFMAYPILKKTEIKIPYFSIRAEFFPYFPVRSEIIPYFPIRQEIISLTH